jgi:hypothetical protein
VIRAAVELDHEPLRPPQVIELQQLPDRHHALLARNEDSETLLDVTQIDFVPSMATFSVNVAHTPDAARKGVSCRRSGVPTL